MRRKRLREEALNYPSVICQGYQILPQNHTPGLAANFWQTSSHFFLFPWGWIYCGKKYGGRKGMALPTFLNCLAINELMTFWIFLAKSCYWNSFLLSFQDYLLLFTFFNHYINMGVFIPLIHCHHCLCSMDKRGGGKSQSQVMKMSHQVWEVLLKKNDVISSWRIPIRSEADGSFSSFRGSWNRVAVGFTRLKVKSSQP